MLTTARVESSGFAEVCLTEIQEDCSIVNYNR